VANIEGHVCGGNYWAKAYSLVGECVICYKIKFQLQPDLEDQIDDHLYSLSALNPYPLIEISPRKEDASENL